jgi:hypothetical protein
MDNSDSKGKLLAITTKFGSLNISAIWYWNKSSKPVEMLMTIMKLNIAYKLTTGFSLTLAENWSIACNPR